MSSKFETSTKTVLCAIVLYLLASGACFFQTRLPSIPGHHWRRGLMASELYSDASGLKSASLVSTDSGSQVCDLEHGWGCVCFETDEEALNWLTAQYKANIKEAQ